MLTKGIYPASTTPFSSDGRIDYIALAKLLAHFEASGCKGVVLAGTNGEGPSLSAVEKRDLTREASGFKGGLDLILGVSTSSLDEAKWLAKQGGKQGASAILLLPPAYFGRSSDAGLAAWLTAVMDAAEAPVILYHNPAGNRIGLPLSRLETLARHPSFGGIKNSASDIETLDHIGSLTGFDKPMFVGDERLIPAGLERGWWGSISGCANVLSAWLVRIVEEFGSESGTAKFQMILPILEELRSRSNPETVKSLQAHLGLIPDGTPRLPLESTKTDDLLPILRDITGIATTL